MTNDIKAAAERLLRGTVEKYSDGTASRIAPSPDTRLVAEAYLTLINRTPSEAAKAAAEEIVHHLCIENAIITLELAAIIQRHIPPVNERLLNAISLCSHVCDNLSHERKYQHGSNKTCPVERIVQSAIAEARAALEGK